MPSHLLKKKTIEINKNPTCGFCIFIEFPTPPSAEIVSWNELISVKKTFFTVASFFKLHQCKAFPVIVLIENVWLAVRFPSKWRRKKGVHPRGVLRLKIYPTLPETNKSPLKIGLSDRKVVFQPSIFRDYVSFREGSSNEYSAVRKMLGPQKFNFVKKCECENIGMILVFCGIRSIHPSDTNVNDTRWYYVLKFKWHSVGSQKLRYHGMKYTPCQQSVATPSLMLPRLSNKSQQEHLYIYRLFPKRGTFEEWIRLKL